MTIDIVPGRHEDLGLAYGIEADDLNWVGLSAFREGLLVGVGGVAWVKVEGPPYLRPTAFLKLPMKYMPPPLIACRLAKQVINAVLSTGAEEIFSFPNIRRRHSRKWLSVLGFKKRGIINGKECWSICKD